MIEFQDFLHFLVSLRFWYFNYVEPCTVHFVRHMKSFLIDDAQPMLNGYQIAGRVETVWNKPKWATVVMNIQAHVLLD